MSGINFMRCSATNCRSLAVNTNDRAQYGVIHLSKSIFIAYDVNVFAGESARIDFLKRSFIKTRNWFPFPVWGRGQNYHPDKLQLRGPWELSPILLTIHCCFSVGRLMIVFHYCVDIVGLKGSIVSHSHWSVHAALSVVSCGVGWRARYRKCAWRNLSLTCWMSASMMDSLREVHYCPCCTLTPDDLQVKCIAGMSGLGPGALQLSPMLVVCRTLRIILNVLLCVWNGFPGFYSLLMSHTWHTVNLKAVLASFSFSTRPILVADTSFLCQYSLRLQFWVFLRRPCLGFLYQLHRWCRSRSHTNGVANAPACRWYLIDFEFISSSHCLYVL